MNATIQENIYERIYSEFLKPEAALIEEISENHFRIILEPFERSFGHTLGHALRRIFLSSMPGAAVVWVQIKDVLHEYSTLSGVREDVFDILLNLKGLAIRLHDKDTVRLVLKKHWDDLKDKDGNTSGAVLAKHMTLPSGVEIANPDHRIATLTEGASIEMEMEVRLGRGYERASSPEQHSVEPEDGLLDDGAEKVIGRLLLDASFSPIKRFVYQVEHTRVGERTDLDKLIIDLETNGTIDPLQAVRCGATILQQLTAFTEKNFEITPEEVEVEEPVEDPIDPVLLRRIDELELSVRATNCLKAEHVIYIGDLVQRKKADLLRMPNLGKKSLIQIQEILDNHNLSLGVTIEGWAKHRHAGGVKKDDSTKD